MDRQAEPFFTAPTVKLVVMSLCTFGLYEFYWFYKNWQVIKDNTGTFLSPGWRATFSPLYAYTCFNPIKIAAEETGMEDLPPVYLLALSYLLLNMLCWSLSLLTDNSLLSFLSSFSFLPIIPVNNLAMRVNEKRSPDTGSNGFSILNGLAIAAYGCFALLSAMASTIQTSIDCAVFKDYPQIAMMESQLNPGSSELAACAKK